MRTLLSRSTVVYRRWSWRVTIHSSTKGRYSLSPFRVPPPPVVGSLGLICSVEPNLYQIPLRKGHCWTPLHSFGCTSIPTRLRAGPDLTSSPLARLSPLSFDSPLSSDLLTPALPVRGHLRILVSPSTRRVPDGPSSWCTPRGWITKKSVLLRTFLRKTRTPVHVSQVMSVH